MNVDSLRIETERLILRPPRAEDFDACAANMADAVATFFIGGQQPRAAAWRGFLWQAQATRLGSSCRGPGRLPAPYEHSPIDIWAQTREQWRRRG